MAVAVAVAPDTYISSSSRPKLRRSPFTGNDDDDDDDNFLKIIITPSR